MSLLLKIHSSRLARFFLVGTGNSTINFAVLNIAFYALHQNKIESSIIATTCAILFSFTLNRSFVFRDKTHPLKKFVRFTAVSAGGVLLIQTSIYAATVTILQHVLSNSFAVINLGNLVASFVVMFWNYHGYRMLVFVDDDRENVRVNDGDATEIETE